MRRKPSINYVNNADFYNRLVEWKQSGETKIPDDIAKTLVMICEHLAESGKFAGYTWKDEMVCDAILSCIKFCGNFDPEKSKNPFAFYSQIAYNSFIKRIGIEKQKLETAAEYKDHVTVLYDLQEDVDDNSDNRYGSIENTAKRINRTYLKPKKAKKKMSATENDIEDYF